MVYVYPSGISSDQVNKVMSILNGQKPDDACFQYMRPRPGQDYDPDIKSYADLQRYSAGGDVPIGREKPVLHIKEFVPYSFHTASTKYKLYNSYSWKNYYGKWSAYGFTLPYGNGFFQYMKSGNSWFFECTPLTVYLTADQRVVRIFTRALPSAPKSIDPLGFGISYATEMHAQTLPMLSYIENHYDFHDYDVPSIVISINIYRGKDAVSFLKTQCISGEWVLPTGQFDPELDAQTEFFDKGLHLRPPGLESSLAGDALSATSFNSNSIANAIDLFTFAKDLKNPVKFFSKIFSSGTRKAAASLWLMYRYAYSTTMLDLDELKRYVSSDAPTVMRSGATVPSGKMQMKIMATPKTNRLGRMIDDLTRSGLAPNAYNMWDLIPFSFIADWFLDVGSVLEDLTQYGRVAAYDISSVTTSWKWKDTFQRGDTTITLVYYERRVSPTAPPYVPYSDGRSASGSTQIKRLIDSVALVS